MVEKNVPDHIITGPLTILITDKNDLLFFKQKDEYRLGGFVDVPSKEIADVALSPNKKYILTTKPTSTSHTVFDSGRSMTEIVIDNVVSCDSFYNKKADAIEIDCQSSGEPVGAM